MTEQTTEQTRPWVLVTGGSRGIGRVIVERLADEGYDIVFTFLKAESLAASLEDALHGQGQRAVGVRCDATDESQVKAMAEHLVAERGAPHALILNAGITQDALLMSMRTEQWDDVISANLRSIFLAARAFLPAMLERRDGAIVLMSSVTALKGNTGQTNYAATKAAMMGVARSLALEVGRFNVRVNAIAPGFIATDMVDGFPEARLAQIKKSIPLRRLGTADDVAALASFLVSANSTYITGQTFVVDGGLSA